MKILIGGRVGFHHIVRKVLYVVIDQDETNAVLIEEHVWLKWTMRERMAELSSRTTAASLSLENLVLQLDKLTEKIDWVRPIHENDDYPNRNCRCQIIKNGYSTKPKASRPMRAFIRNQL